MISILFSFSISIPFSISISFLFSISFSISISFFVFDFDFVFDDFRISIYFVYINSHKIIKKYVRALCLRIVDIGSAQTADPTNYHKEIGRRIPPLKKGCRINPKKIGRRINPKQIQINKRKCLTGRQSSRKMLKRKTDFWLKTHATDPKIYFGFRPMQPTI